MQYKRVTLRDINNILKLDDRFGSSWSRGLYMERLSMYPDLAYGAFNNGKLVGFILGKRDLGGITISRIVVERKLEGHGIGGNLVDVLTKSVSGKAEEMNSNVRKSNLRSLNLHKHRGFNIFGYHIYKDGELGFKMKKRL